MKNVNSKLNLAFQIKSDWSKKNLNCRDIREHLMGCSITYPGAFVRHKIK